MGCNQSQNVLQIDLSSTNGNKSDIAKIIIEEYDQILIEIQNCRKQIQQQTGFPMNQHILGEYRQDYFLISQFTQQQSKDKVIDKELSEKMLDISKKLKTQCQRYSKIRQQIEQCFEQKDQMNDYYLEIEWKDQVLLNYFKSNSHTPSQTQIETPNSTLSSPPSRSKQTSVVSKLQDNIYLSGSSSKSCHTPQQDSSFSRITKSNFF